MKIILTFILFIGYLCCIAQVNGIEIHSFRAGGLTDEEDTGKSLTTDKNGNIYVTGHFWGAATFGNITVIAESGFSDIFLAKYNNLGEIQWVKKAGGPYDDSGDGIAVDNDGNIYITGHFYQSVNFETNSLISNGDNDIFLAKYDTNGNLSWIQKAGGNSGDFGKSISIDSHGNIVLTGYFSSSANFGGWTIISNGGPDIFLAKYSSDGTILWAKNAGGTSFDYATGIRINANDEIVIVGYFGGTAIFDNFSITTPTSGVFITKYSSNGTALWAKNSTSDGTGQSSGLALFVNNSNEIIICGLFLENLTLGQHQVSTSQSRDGFIAKLNNNGDVIWLKNSIGICNAIIGNNQGDFFTTGYRYSIEPPNYFDIYVAKFNSSGNMQKLNFFGDIRFDIGFGITNDIYNNVFVTGQFGNTVAFGNDTLVSHGNYDILLLKMKYPSNPCLDNISLQSPENDINGQIKEIKVSSLTGTISANNVISNYSNVLLSAGKSIILFPGFKVNSNSVVRVEIGGCN